MRHYALFPRDKDAAEITDLYELTMAAGYFETGLDCRATFELWVRNLPPGRSYLVACGLADALRYLAEMRFTPESIDYIRRHESFKNVSKKFFDYLADFRFTGDAWAIPEGRVVFQGEPLIRVSAPIIESQMVETFLLSVLNYQTTIATKASRIVSAANLGGVKRGVVDFGLRRAHGPSSGVSAARAAFIGGCIGTSNVHAGRVYDIPTYGTAAHSWVMAFDTEIESFREYYRVFPDSAILLIDTYDVRKGALNAARIGARLLGVRLDSGDVAAQSKMVRGILDEAGLGKARIMASGDLNEFKINDMLRRGAPIDVFGVGTDLVTSRDEPALQCVYKLVELEKDGRRVYKIKLSKSKGTLPGAKQVFRFRDRRGEFARDVIALAGEPTPRGAEALLVPVMRRGRLVKALPTLRKSQRLAEKDVERLPEKFRRLKGPAKYPVSNSRRLEALFRRVKKECVGGKAQ